MRWDYLHMIAETMRDLRQEALEADGYVAELRCEDRWQDELDYVRDCIEKSHRNVAKRRAQVARAEEQLARWGTVHGDYWLHNVEFSREWLRRAETVRRVEQAARDELKQALAYMKRERRRNLRELEIVRAELARRRN